MLQSRPILPAVDLVGKRQLALAKPRQAPRTKSRMGQQGLSLLGRHVAASQPKPVAYIGARAGARVR